MAMAALFFFSRSGTSCNRNSKPWFKLHVPEFAFASLAGVRRTSLTIP